MNIVAPWHDYSPDDRNTVVINLLGQSFGTGQHETTQLCADIISELDLNGKIVVDYSCGSGVLAICALEAEDLPLHTQADVTVANLYADALVALSGDLIQLTTDSGWIVLSGILRPQVKRVSRAYFGHVDFTARYDGDWVALLGKKPCKF